MTETPVRCPCCGQTTTGSGVRVDLGENTLYFNGTFLRLKPRLAELAFILARRMPETVPNDVIIAQMWGDAEPDFAANNVKVAIMQLRAELRIANLRIVTNWTRGYRMEVVPAASRTERTTEHQHAHA